MKSFIEVERVIGELNQLIYDITIGCPNHPMSYKLEDARNALFLFTEVRCVLETTNLASAEYMIRTRRDRIINYINENDIRCKHTIMPSYVRFTRHLLIDDIDHLNWVLGEDEHVQQRVLTNFKCYERSKNV